MAPPLHKIRTKIATALTTLAAVGVMAFPRMAPAQESALIREGARRPAARLSCDGISRKDTLVNLHPRDWAKVRWTKVDGQSATYFLSVGPFNGKHTVFISTDDWPTDTLYANFDMAQFPEFNPPVKIIFRPNPNERFIFTLYDFHYPSVDSPKVYTLGFNLARETKNGDLVAGDHRYNIEISGSSNYRIYLDSLFFLDGRATALLSIHDYTTDLLQGRMQLHEGETGIYPAGLQPINITVSIIYLGANWAKVYLCVEDPRPNRVSEPAPPASNAVFYPAPLASGQPATLLLNTSGPANLHISLHDIRGIEVAKLWEGQTLPNTAIGFAVPSGLPAGTYFYRVSAGGQTVDQKPIIIMK